MAQAPPEEQGAAATGGAAEAHSSGAAKANGGFNFSFSSTVAKKRGRGGDVSVQPREEVRKELVTGFEGGRLQSADPAAPVQGGKRVIAKLDDTFRVGVGPRKFNPSRFLPAHAEEEANGDHFELAAPEQQAEVTYGLSKRARPSEREAGGPEPGSGQTGSAAGPSVTSREWELQKYKQDIAQLPEAAGLDAYQAMPVELFGEAMLRGMGWQEGRCVGKNGKGEVQAKEYVPRPAKLGLGATPSEILAKPPKKHIRQGESREPKKDMVYVDANGHQKHVKDAGTVLTERAKTGAAVGKAMRVLSGPHAGLLCTVMEIKPKAGEHSERAAVRLQPSGERASVRLKELGETWESAPAADEDADVDADGGGGHPPKHKHKHHKDKKHHKHRERGHRDAADADRPAAASREERNGGADVDEEQDGREAQRPWLAPHIMVKIVDKHLRGGRLYLKKAEVVDVPEPTSCSLILAASGEAVANVRQAQLETIVPKQVGMRVLVVAGPLRGRRARLLVRDSGAATARVQLTAELTVHELGFDDVSEYVGEAGEEE